MICPFCKARELEIKKVETEEAPVDFQEEGIAIFTTTICTNCKSETKSMTGFKPVERVVEV